MAMSSCIALLFALGYLAMVAPARRVVDLKEETPSRIAPRSPGGVCQGAFFKGSRGNCTSTTVTAETGKQYKVKQYCYAPGATQMDRKAETNELGACYIPNSKPCDNSRQCRPGTFCLPLDSGDELFHGVLGPIGFANGLDDQFWGTLRSLQLPFVCKQDSPGTLPTQAAARVAAIVQEMASRTLSSDPGSGSDMMRRSGVLSPFAGSPLMDQMLLEVNASFVIARLKKHAETSRSGATFVYSGDGRFIAKMVRQHEYDAMGKHLMGRLAELARINEATCSSSGGSPVGNCWASAALAHTTLNLPLVAFLYRDQPWVVLPVSGVLRKYADGNDVLGNAEYFDVKPVWSHSNQRADFFEYLAKINFVPNDPNSPKEIQDQWEDVQNMLQRDVKFLSSDTSHNTPPFVDYSFLFEVYSPASKVTTPGPGCVVSAGCLPNAGPQQRCHVVCMNIIDYFLAYDSFLKRLESNLVYEKWHNYIEKAKTMLDCVGDLSRFQVSQGTLSIVNDADAEPRLMYELESTDDSSPFSGSWNLASWRQLGLAPEDDGWGLVEVYLNYTLPRRHRAGTIVFSDEDKVRSRVLQSTCADYRPLACNSFKRRSYDSSRQSIYTEAYHDKKDYHNRCIYQSPMVEELDALMRTCKQHLLMDCISHAHAAFKNFVELAGYR